MNQINRSVNKISYVAFALLLFLPLGCGPSSGTDDFALAYDFVRNNLDDDNWEYLNSDSSLKARLNADIRLAISTSDSRLKDGSLPGEIFCEYLLAPSVNTELFDDWRSECLSSFSYLRSDKLSLETILDTLNTQLRKQFTFQNERTIVEHNWSTYQKGNMRGTCWDMATLILFPLRALGYAATIDFTPVWGNMDGSHSWNSVYAHGRMTPFMGMESNMDGYNPFVIYNGAKDSAKNAYKRPAKVFRITFSDNEMYKRIKNKYPSLGRLLLFKHLKFKDVTSEYFSVSDLTVKRPCDYLGDVLFLSVFSGGKWIETCVTEVSENNCFIFRDLNREMLYLLVKPDGTTAEVPWILDKNGKISELRPDLHDRGDMEIIHLLPRIMEYSKVWGMENPPKDIWTGIEEDYYRKHPEENQCYKLFTYLSKWVKVGEATAGKNRVVFNNVPKGGLFMMTDGENMPVGRPFTYADKECRWW